jgi:hypothetical protein
MTRAALALGAAVILLPSGDLQTQQATKFTMHVDLVQTPASGPPNEWARFVSQIATQAIPPGGVDQTIIVSATASRIEQHQAFAGMPAGVVTLFRAGEEFGYDPAARTFWKQPARLSAQELSAMSAMKPEITVDKTGKFEIIEGRRAERVVTTLTLPMPAEAAAAPIPGLPPTLVVTIQAWVTDAVKLPKGSVVPVVDRKLLAQLGLAHLAEFTDDRFLVKATAAINFITGIELVMTATDVATVNVPASTFDVPAGFREVKPPSGRGGN